MKHCRHSTNLVSAVAAGNNYAFEPIPAERPIYDVSPAGLKEQLRKIISDPDLRTRLGREGRAFVEKHHGHTAVCRYIVDCLSGRIREQHFPEYFAREYRLPDGQSIPPKLQGLTTEIVEQNGVPKSLDVRGLVERGLMAKPAQAAAVWEQN